ncbi:hypothetical protein ABTK65_19865, partial [Acinetobacter baumannii]
EAVALADRVLLIDRGGIALDASVALPRPRSRTTPAFTELEERVLRHVIGHPPAACAAAVPLTPGSRATLGSSANSTPPTPKTPRGPCRPTAS